MSTTKPTVTVEIDFTTDLSAGLSYYEQVAASGPYVWHRLQETAGTSIADSSGNGVTGTSAGTITFNQTSGKPVSGETASRYVNFGSDGDVYWRAPTDIGVGRFTVEAWVYQATLSGSGSTAYTIMDNFVGGNPSFSILGDGKLRVRVIRGGSSLAIDSTTAPISAANWYHLAVVVDAPSNTVMFYVNGAPVAPTAWTGQIDIFSSYRDFYWGTRPGFPFPPNNSVSRIAEPALYLSCLDGSIIADHYAAAATTPFAGYTWTDVTDYLLVDPGLTRKLGRESSLEEVAPMETTYLLVNDDRRFEIGNSESPYYPNVVPGRPTRVRMTQDAATYDWAFGLIEDFPQQWDTSGRFGRVPIVAHCFLARMNQHKVTNRRVRQQTAGERMTVLANTAGVPTAMREIDAGANDVMEQTLESATAGDHARQVARTDRGLVYFDGRGYMVFQDGDYRTTNTRATLSRGTLGPVGSVDIVTLGAPDFHAPSSLIFNEITLRRPGGVDQTVADGPSRSKYGPRSHQDELLLPTDAQIAVRAAELLADYKDPTLRVRAIRFNPARSPGQWDHALGVVPSDRYTWFFLPQQGSSIFRDVLVEGVEDRWAGAEYVSTWFLSVAPVFDVVSGSFRGLLALTS